MRAAPHVEQRSISKQWSVDNLLVEYAPFQFEMLDKTGAQEIRSASWGYIDDLPRNVMSLLENLHG